MGHACNYTDKGEERERGKRDENECLSKKNENIFLVQALQGNLAIQQHTS